MIRVLIIFCLVLPAFAQVGLRSPAFVAQLQRTAEEGGESFDPDAPTAFEWANSSISGMDGAAWGTWADTSGNGKDLTEPTAPPYVTNNVENSKSAIRFEIGKLLASSADLAVPYTIAGVIMADDSGANRRDIVALTDNRLIALGRSGGNSAFLGANVSNHQPAANTAHTFILSVFSSGAVYYVDGTNRTDTTTTAADFNDVGMGAANGFSEYSTSYIFDVRGWNEALTTNQMNTLGQWLTNNVAGRWVDIP